MKFKGWQKLSLIEWPNKICSVVFVGGCNFRCPWCYNQDLVWHPEKLPDIDEKEILEYLERNKNLLEGVMITGGEPTILFEARGVPRFCRTTEREDKIVRPPKLRQSRSEGGLQIGLKDFIKKVKKIGLAVGVETNGSNPEAIEYLIKNELVDYIAMDIKGPFEQEKYNQLTGINVSLDKIKKSVKIIIEKATDYEFRTTFVPGLLTEDILKIAEDIKRAKRYYLQQYCTTRINADQDANQLKKIGEKIKNYFQIFGVR